MIIVRQFNSTLINNFRYRYKVLKINLNTVVSFLYALSGLYFGFEK